MICIYRATLTLKPKKTPAVIYMVYINHTKVANDDYDGCLAHSNSRVAKEICISVFFILNCTTAEKQINEHLYGVLLFLHYSFI